MQMTVGKELATLQGMTVTELRAKYETVFGEAARSHNKDHLLKRIAWRVQAMAEGDLSERARRRAAELANDADLRTTAPKRRASTSSGRTKQATLNLSNGDRLPMPGSEIAREYKGKTIVVTVLPKGFEYDGHVYRSLTAVAKAITGTHWNGYHFFGLNRGKEGK